MVTTENCVTKVLQLAGVADADSWQAQRPENLGKAMYCIDEENYVLRPGVEAILRVLLEDIELATSEILEAAGESPDAYLKYVGMFTTSLSSELLTEKEEPLVTAAKLLRDSFSHHRELNKKVHDGLKVKRNWRALARSIAVMVCQSTQKMASLKYILDHYGKIGRTEVDRERYRLKLHARIAAMSDMYGWYRSYSIEENPEETKIGMGANNVISIAINEKDMTDLVNAKIDTSDCRLNGKKIIIGAIEAIPEVEIQKAAKKISTPIGLNGVKAYEINAGIKLDQLRSLSDHWHLRGVTPEHANSYISSLEGAVYVQVETPEGSYNACATSLGRALSAVSKKMQNAVMENLELSF